jgi:hypothetical protein
MTEITAATMLARFNYKSTDFDPDDDEDTSLTNVEYIIDDVIDYINLIAGTSISNLSGTSPDKTVTVTGPQNAAIKMLLPLMLRDTKYHVSESTGLGPVSVSNTVSTQNPAFQKMFEKAIATLKYSNLDPPIYVSNDPVP